MFTSNITSLQCVDQRTTRLILDFIHDVCHIWRMAPPKKLNPKRALKIHLDPPLLAWLKLEARRLDVSMSEVLRRLIRKEMGA